MPRLLSLVGGAALLAALCIFAFVPNEPPAIAGSAPDRWWPTYGGDFANTRHADLDDISPATVGKLATAWTFATRVSGQMESSPLAVDGTVYVTTGPDNGVFALNAETGTLKWHYVPPVGTSSSVFAVNRGVAADRGRVFFATLDNALIALDARSGARIWSTRIGSSRDGLSESAAPLAWGGLVFIGSSGGEFGVRGSYSAYSAVDGHLVWRWWSVAPGWEGSFRPSVRGFDLHRDITRERAAAARNRGAWKHGGGAVWMTPALSRDESTIYLSTGNPAPAFDGAARPGDNLYTDCIVALDARSGKMKWYFQETPHDVWDYDAASPPVLFAARDAAGHAVPAVGEAGKNGWLFVVDRRTGQLIRVSEPFVPQPHLYAPVPAGGAAVQPGDEGGAIGPIAFDPALHAAFVPGNVAPERAERSPAGPWQSAAIQWKGGSMDETGGPASGLLSRIDTDTGRVVWRTPVPTLMFGGPLSTGGLLFTGEELSADFKAYDARTGSLVWRTNLSDELARRSTVPNFFFHLIDRVRRLRHPDRIGEADVHAPAIAYRAGGREYIVVAADVFATKSRPGGNTVFAFTLR